MSPGIKGELAMSKKPEDGSPEYMRDLPFEVEIGTVVRLEDESSWCVIAIDNNKQEYRLPSIFPFGMPVIIISSQQIMKT